MALTESTRLHQIILEADETGALSRVFRYDLNLVLRDGVELNRSLHITPLEAADKRVKNFLSDSVAEVVGGLQRQTQIASEAISGRDAALARVDNLESQIAELQGKLDAKG